jgi:PAS domain S-box-containing protein
MEILSRLLDVPSTDPDDARRRRLLNILLSSTTAITVLGLVVTLIFDLLDLEPGANTLYQAGAVMLAGLLLIFLINRYWLGWVAATLFLLLFIAVFSFDSPGEVVEGRTLFMYAIPILMASVILRSYASLLTAAFINVVIIVIAIRAGLTPNAVGGLALFLIGLVSWLSARSLERALSDVRTINRELDQRVADRTQDLAEALAREHSEASQNQAILEGIADGVIVFDSEGRAIIANPAIGRLLDKEMKQIVGANIQELMPADVSAADRELITYLLHDTGSRRPSIKVGWGARTLSVSFAPVRGVGQEATGTVAVFRDFTKEAEVDRMKSDFVSIASHELRTPLTSIKGYLELVMMGAGGPVSEQQAQFLRVARDNADRLYELVDGLLDVSRIESGRIELDVKLLSLAEIIDVVAMTLQKQFEERGLALKLEIEPNLPQVLGDPGRISQVMFNLMSNAYKYTPEGQVTVRAYLKENAIHVNVIDTGLGISAKDQEKLFSRFFRAGDAAVRQQPGTGLGLNITKSLIEMHGGQIWVESEQGQGSAFNFTLPLPAGLVSAHKLDEVAARPAPAATGKRVMVVDNEPDVALMVQRFLELEGYQATVVTQGSQVLETARQLQPDLITLDLLMDVDGLAVLQQLKMDPVTAGIPVVIVSVVPESEKGLVLGASEYLTKPIDEGALMERVRQLLQPADGNGRGKILVVDDEKDIIGWLKAALGHHGYEVHEAYNGQQALLKVDQEQPDLIILDMMMPVMDGRTTLNRLRQRGTGRHVPVIVLSANTIDDADERAMMQGMGVREFLHKPVSVNELVSEVQKHLNGRTVTKLA